MRRYANHLYQRVSASRVVFTSVILLSGCFTSYDDTELDASEKEAVFDPGAPLPEFVISGEMDLATGRLAKIPVSWFPEYTVDVVGAHDVMFRATCGSTATCDTGLLVSEPTLGSLYNDDDPGGPTAHGAGPGGSFVDPPARSASARYTVRAFSLRRATSKTSVQWSANGGVTWTSLSPVTPLGSGINVGGTLIRVGALSRGDYLEVMSRSNGAQSDDTRMILFSVNNAAGHPLTTAEDQSTTDRDPRIDIATDAWTGANNVVLIGKQAPPIPFASNQHIETRVDLVHGPLSQVTYMPPLRDCRDCTGANVPPGRYLTYLRAYIDLPVGAYNSTSNQHLSGNMPVLDADGCPNSQRDGDVNASWFRGVGNDLVMRMELQLWNGTAWVAAARRVVPRGAFGGLPGEWTRFSIPLEVVSPGTTYRLVATSVAPGVVVAGGWHYERNPEATELGVASANTLFKRMSFDDSKYKNTADLLGTRGSIISSEARVEERADQAPFQWDADIIGMQEVAKTDSWDFNYPDNRFTDVVLNELRLRSSVLWTYAQGRGETWFAGASDGPGMNPIFVNSQAATGAMPSSVYFSATAKDVAGCSDNGGTSNYAECHLSEQGLGDGEISNYATAARAGSWRGDGNDRPIAVFNVHLEASDGARDFAPRLGEVRSLMNKIDALLTAEPSAFNRAAGDATRTSPLHAQNRFIIVGDWNIRAHECGEHYWILRMLRERYGYAIDVSMARTDAAGSLKQSMHTGDAPYVGEVPGGYQHMWTTDPRQPPAWTGWRSTHDHAYNSAFPWWATDWRDKTSTPDEAGERLSMIVLVGKGWADDDPVLDYTVMSDSNYASPMNPLSRGVEMWRPHLPGVVYQLCTDAGSVANDARGYAPNYSLGCDSNPAGGTNPGAPALHTDHRPMGARVRVWSR